MPQITFRRAFVDHEAVCVETEPGIIWTLPNPTPDGRRYLARTVLAAVAKARVINTDNWRRG